MKYIDEFVHNVIVHPLMMVVPRRFATFIHDAHANRIFGKNRYDELAIERAMFNGESKEAIADIKAGIQKKKNKSLFDKIFSKKDQSERFHVYQIFQYNDESNQFNIGKVSLLDKYLKEKHDIFLSVSYDDIFGYIVIEDLINGASFKTCSDNRLKMAFVDYCKWKKFDI